MSKVTLNNVTSGFTPTTLINANNTAITNAIENTLSRDGTGPNQMNATLDMNGNMIINQANPITVNGFNWKGPWVTGSNYSIGDVIESSNSSYIAIITHTAGASFATDLAAGKWQVVASSANLPSQSGNAGKLITTDGFNASWTDTFNIPYTFNGNNIFNGINNFTGTNNFTNISSFSNSVYLNSTNLTLSGSAIVYSEANVTADPTNSNIWTSNYVALGGSATTITNFPVAPQAGAEVELRCIAAHTFTNNSNLLVSGGTYTAGIGDLIRVRALTTSTFRLTINKASPYATNSDAQAGAKNYLIVTPANLNSTVLGMGQTWQNMSGSRAVGVSYTNTTGRPIQIAVAGTISVTGYLVLAIGASNVAYSCTVPSGSTVSLPGIVVQNNASYAIATSSGALSALTWWELR